MTFLTFAEKCGGLGASALAGGSAAAANKRSFIKEASAIVPRPVPHSRKKCRRVITLRISELCAPTSAISRCCLSTMKESVMLLLSRQSPLITRHPLLLCYRLVQVQQHIRNDGPGSFFPHWSAFGPWQVTHQG